MMKRILITLLLLCVYDVTSRAAITDNLVSHWKQDEASGNATDSHGSNTLAETSGTIASVAGKVVNSRDYEAGDTERFVLADNASLSITGNITVCAWINAESFTNSPGTIASKYLTTGNQRSYRLNMVVTTGRPSFGVSQTGTAETAVATWGSNLSTATWYFVCGRYDGTNVSISVNAGTPVTAAYSSGIFDSTAPFILGSQADNDFSGTEYDGLIDEVSVWSRALSDAEVTTLYNSGNGLAYPWAETFRPQVIISRTQPRVPSLLDPARWIAHEPHLVISP